MDTIAPPSLFERIMATLPGWMLLLGGVAMVAMITLVPPWLECRRLDWQTQVMAIQSEQLASQQVAYEQFLTALREDDPVVIERMAYYHLRLKPAGTWTLDELNQRQTAQTAVYNQTADHTHLDQNSPYALPMNKVWSTLPTIEDLLAKPMYRPSQYCPAGVIPETRMVRLVTGPARHVMLGLGVLCLFFGLLPVSAGALLTAKPVIDELDQSYDELDDFDPQFDAQDDDDAFVATLDDAAPHATDDLYPDASEAAWALAGTGAVCVSAARSTFGDEHDVLVAELDEQEGHADLAEVDGDLVEATLEEDEAEEREEDEDHEIDAADKELDETESEEDEEYEEDGEEEDQEQDEQDSEDGEEFEDEDEDVDEEDDSEDDDDDNEADEEEEEKD